MRLAHNRMLTLIAALLGLVTGGTARAGETTVQHFDPQGRPLGRTELQAGQAREFDREGRFLGHEEAQGDRVVAYDKEGRVVGRDRVSR